MASPQAFSTSAAGVVFDNQGVAIPPKASYPIIEQWARAYVTAWSSLEDMSNSLNAMAPTSKGLPEGAPSPNAVYAEGGMLYRYIVDPDFQRVPFVNGDAVEERMQFRRQPVALTLDGARRETDQGRETDFWCGFTWIRGGYSPERTSPVEVQAEAERQGGQKLVFSQPMSPTDEARIRHEVARMDRQAPTLAVEPAAQKRRGRKSSDDTAGGDLPPAED